MAWFFREADMSPLFEPSFAALGAELDLTPAMNAEDLQMGLAALAAS
jgi:hypothetical protein